MADAKQVSQLTEDMLSDKEKKIFKMLVKAGTPKQEALESILGLTKAGERKLERGKRMAKLMNVVKPAFDLAVEKLLKTGDVKVGDKFLIEFIKDGVSLKPVGAGKGVGKVSADLTIEGKTTHYESCTEAAKALQEHARKKNRMDIVKAMESDMGTVSWHRTLPRYVEKIKGVSVKFAGE